MGEEERGNGRRRCRLDSNLNLSQAPQLCSSGFQKPITIFLECSCPTRFVLQALLIMHRMGLLRRCVQLLF